MLICACVRIQISVNYLYLTYNVCVGMQKLEFATLSEVIRARRKAVGLSQQDLAEFAGCSRLFVSELERGKLTFQFDKFLAVLTVLGLRMKIVQKEDNET
jgi:HTH-type transcriptional regulator/antitoxin HipB